MSEPVQPVEEAVTEAAPGASGVSVVTLLGRPFKVADKVGLMPLLRFAHMAGQGLAADDMEALGAMYDLLRGVIADDDWGAFQSHASMMRADQDDLLEAVREAIEMMTARPTVRPSDSSDGPPATGTSSVVVWSSQESSTPEPGTGSPVAKRRLGPIMDDPRVQALLPLADAAKAL